MPSESHRWTPAGAVDAPLLLAFLGAHAVPGVESWDGQTYARTLDLPGGPGVLAVAAEGDGVVVDLHVGASGDLPHARRRSRELLALDDDPGEALAQLSADTVLGGLVAKRPGVRVPGDVDAAETAVRAVIGQQVSVAGARTVTGRIAAEYGTPVDLPAAHALGLDRLFPRSADLAAADPQTLPMPRARGRTVVGLAAALDGRTVTLARGADTATTTAALVSLPGIGPWTAAVVALRALGDPDVFLPTDLGVRRALEALGRRGDPAAAAEAALAWRPHRSLALMHLWCLVVFGPAPELRDG